MSGLKEPTVDKLRRLQEIGAGSPKVWFDLWKSLNKKEEVSNSDDDIAPPLIRTQKQKKGEQMTPQESTLNRIFKSKGDIAKQLYRMTAPEYSEQDIRSTLQNYSDLIDSDVRPIVKIQKEIIKIPRKVKDFNTKKQLFLYRLDQIRQSELNQQGINKLITGKEMKDLMKKLGIDKDIASGKFPIKDFETNYDYWKIKSGKSDKAYNAISNYLDNKEQALMDKQEVLKGFIQKVNADVQKEMGSMYTPPKSLNLQMHSEPIYAKLARLQEADTNTERPNLNMFRNPDAAHIEPNLQEEDTNTERPELGMSEANSIQKEQRMPNLRMFRNPNAAHIEPDLQEEDTNTERPQLEYESRLGIVEDRPSKPDLDLSNVKSEYERLQLDAEDEDEDEDERPELKDPADEVSTLKDSFDNITKYQEYLDPKAFADLAKNVKAMQDYITEISVLSAKKGADAGKIAGAREKFEEIKSTVRKNLQNSYKQIMDKLTIYKDAVSAEDALINEIKSLASYEQYTQLPPAIFEQLPEDIKKKCLYLMELKAKLQKQQGKTNRISQKYKINASNKPVSEDKEHAKVLNPMLNRGYAIFNKVAQHNAYNAGFL